MNRFIVNSKQIEYNTVIVKCGSDRGSGFIVSCNHVITAFHVVKSAVSDNQKITMQFPAAQSKGLNSVEGTLLNKTSDSDIAIIAVDYKFPDSLPLCSSRIRYNSPWETFGFPHTYLEQGVRIEGKILKTNDNMPFNIELSSLDIDSQINYDGFSGASLVVNRQVVGVISWSIVNGLGAISIEKISALLDEYSIGFQHEDDPEVALGEFAEEINDSIPNEETIEQIRKTVLKGTDYYLLTGSPGSGKSVLCASLSEIDENIDIVGKYFVRTPNESRTLAQRSSREALIGWLEDLISEKLTNTPHPYTNKPVHERLSSLSQMLHELNSHYSNQQMQCLIVIDGLDDIALLGENQVSEFLGVFPQILPSNISVLLSASRIDILPIQIRSRISEQNIIEQSMLPLELCHDYLKDKFQWLGIDLDTVELDRIASKSEGHPLYLQYIVELIKEHQYEDISTWINNLPVIGKNISTYYEQIWISTLSNDDHLSKIVLTISQTRTPVEFHALHSMLNKETRFLLRNKIGRIKHLLSITDRIGIYHSSFGLFIEDKCADNLPEIHDNISEYCIENRDTVYSITNCIYHALRSTHKDNAIVGCTQQWVDSCGMIHADPISIMRDIYDVEQLCVASKKLTDLLRIKLLRQRISFRYNNILAAYADKIAIALINMGNPQDSLKYLYRGEALLLDNKSAIDMHHLLIHKGYVAEAQKITDSLKSRYQYRANKELKSFTLEFKTIALKLDTIIMLILEGRSSGSYFEHTVKLLLNNDFSQGRDDAKTKLLLGFYSAKLSASIMGLKAKHFDFYSNVKDMGIDINSEVVQQLFRVAMFINDIGSAINASLSKSNYTSLLNNIFSMISGFVPDYQADTKEILLLIEEGSQSDIVLSLLRRINLDQVDVDTSLRDKNGVDLDYESVYAIIDHYTMLGYLDSNSCYPELPRPSIDWEKFCIDIIRNIGFILGKSYRCRAEKDTSTTQLLRKKTDDVLTNMVFSLKDRVSWDRSYFIPEHLFPIIYRHIFKILVEFFPDDVDITLTDLLQRGVSTQLGLYSEGYRDCLRSLATELSCNKELRHSSFLIVKELERFATLYVENRWDLIPELLFIMNMYAKIENFDLCKRTYSRLLDYSMGPTWYKEDQLSLITEVLNLPYASLLPIEIFRKFAGDLEYSAGELTFQRYVRQEKEIFINRLVKAGHVISAIEYYKHQVLPDPQTTLMNAESSNVDSLEPGEGYYNGADNINEAHGVYQLIKSMEIDPLIKLAIIKPYVINEDTERYLDGYLHVIATCILDTHKRYPQHLHRCFSFSLDLLSNEEIRDRFNSNLITLCNDLSHPIQMELQGFLLHNNINFNVLKANDSDQNGTGVFKQDIDEEALDGFRLPGMGTNFRNDVSYLSDQILKAKEEMKLENHTAARSQLIEGIKRLQNNQSDVWHGNLTSELKEALRLLPHTGNWKEIISDMSEFIQDHYTEDWIVVSRLIDLLRDKFNCQETTDISYCISEHVDHIVHCDSSYTDRFDWIIEDGDNLDCDSIALDFLLWMPDHPDIRIKRQACVSLMWLAELIPDFVVPILISKSLTGLPNISSELSAQLLSKIALKYPDTVNKHLIGDGVIDKLLTIKHFMIRQYYIDILQDLGRNYKRALDVYRQMISRIPSKIVLTSSFLFRSRVSKSNHYLLKRLNQINLLKPDLINNIEEYILDYSHPLSIEDQLRSNAYTIRSFPHIQFIFGNYDAICRYAINVALCDQVGTNDLESVKEILSWEMI
jgi:hypothetical protein